MKYSYLLIIIWVWYSQVLQAQGKLLDKTFYSSSLKTNRSYLIYLPQGYSQDNKEIRYPTIYFLHGSTVNEHAYSSIGLLLDAMISSSQIPPVIVAMPDGSCKPYAGSFYTNSALYGNFEDFIIKDFIEQIDNNYNTVADRKMRGITGHSMGAYGALKLALKFPVLFNTVASLSGPLNFQNLDTELFPLILEGKTPPYDFKPDTTNIYIYETFSMAGAFSPNMSNPPYFVDLPFDNNGKILNSVMDKWQAHNVANIAKLYDKKYPLSIYFDCGDKDHFALMEPNQSFSDTLTKYNIQHDFEKFKGGHVDKLLFRAPIALKFLIAAFNNTVGINKKFAQKQCFINISTIGNKNLQLTVISEKNENAKLEFINELGQIKLIKNLNLQNGNNYININLNTLNKGFYILNLQNLSKTFETNKLIIN